MGRYPAAARQRDERGHSVIKNALDQGLLDSGQETTLGGFSNHDAANQGRKILRVAGEHLHVSVPAWVVDQNGTPCWGESRPAPSKRYKQCEDPATPHSVVFRIHSLDAARGYVVREAQGDPSKLKYNPFQRNEGPIVDDAGNRIR